MLCYIIILIPTKYFPSNGEVVTLMNVFLPSIIFIDNSKMRHIVDKTSQTTENVNSYRCVRTHSPGKKTSQFIQHVFISFFLYVQFRCAGIHTLIVIIIFSAQIICKIDHPCVIAAVFMHCANGLPYQ